MNECQNCAVLFGASQSLSLMISMMCTFFEVNFTWIYNHVLSNQHDSNSDDVISPGLQKGQSSKSSNSKLRKLSLISLHQVYATNKTYLANIIQINCAVFILHFCFPKSLGKVG